MFKLNQSHSIKEKYRYKKDWETSYVSQVKNLLDKRIKKPHSKKIGNFNKAQEEMLKKAMDSMRLVGNKAVHPSALDFDDNSEVANILFVMLNFIVEEVLTKPVKMKENLEKLNQVIKKSKDNQSK